MNYIRVKIDDSNATVFNIAVDIQAMYSGADDAVASWCSTSKKLVVVPDKPRLNQYRKFSSVCSDCDTDQSRFTIDRAYI
jgi:hypothetical protein